MKRTELTEGVFLNYLHSEKFKTSLISVSLLTSLKRETASMNALIPFVLRRGTATYPDMTAVSNRLDELYGAVIEPVVRRIGEIQCLGLVCSFAESDFLPESVTRDTLNLLGEMVLHPATRGGLFLPAYVESEKQNLIDLINSSINEKRSYSIKRCGEEMCCYEDYSVGRFGSAEDCEDIEYKKLTKRYRELLSSSPVEIFYCGRESEETVISALSDAFAGMPRGNIDYDLGTDIRMNAVEASPRYYEEHLDITQGKLCIGYRLGDTMENPDWAALSVFNCVFGSGVTSKLFMNVREKLNICYYASSIVDIHKGIMLVASGIDFDRFEEAKNEIEHQLDDVREGNITDDELAYAKAGVASDLRAMLDVPYALESFYISNIIDGLDCTVEELAEITETITKEDVIEIAKGIECDLVYFLRNGGCEEDDE